MKMNYRSLLLVLSLAFLLLPANTIAAQQPEYAKWSKIAIEKAKEQYPEKEFVEYLYEGKVIISEKREQYNFKLDFKLNDENKEVRVYVLVNPKNEQLIDVHFDEVQ